MESPYGESLWRVPVESPYCSCKLWHGGGCRVWTDGTPYDLTFWGPSQPNDDQYAATEQDCVSAVAAPCRA